MICGLDSMQQDKSRLYVEKGTPTHAFELAEKLRESDIFECALGGNHLCNRLYHHLDIAETM